MLKTSAIYHVPVTAFDLLLCMGVLYMCTLYGSAVHVYIVWECFTCVHCVGVFYFRFMAVLTVNGKRKGFYEKWKSKNKAEGTIPSLLASMIYEMSIMSTFCECEGFVVVCVPVYNWHSFIRECCIEANRTKCLPRKLGCFCSTFVTSISPVLPPTPFLVFPFCCCCCWCYCCCSVCSIVVVHTWFLFLLDGMVDDSQSACPRLLCFLTGAKLKELILWRVCVWCLCMYVLFNICVRTNFVDFKKLVVVMTCMQNN